MLTAATQPSKFEGRGAAHRERRRQVKKTSVLRGGEPFPLGAGAVRDQIVEDAVWALVRILFRDGTKRRKMCGGLIRFYRVAVIGGVLHTRRHKDSFAFVGNGCGRRI